MLFDTLREALKHMEVDGWKLTSRISSGKNFYFLRRLELAEISPAEGGKWLVTK